MRGQEENAGPLLERIEEKARKPEQTVSTLDEARTLAQPEVHYELPDCYGQDRIVAMVRDPYWVHVYWEITEDTLSQALASLGRAAKGGRSVLRVYRDNGKESGSEQALFDIFLTPQARNWYINVGGPGGTYWVDVGLLVADGRFIRLARSNSVTTPLDRMSDVLDEECRRLSSHYEEMYTLSGGLGRDVGSSELHEMLARRLELGLASSFFSPSAREIPA